MDDNDSDEPVQTEQTPGRPQKRARVGRLAKWKDFWGQVDTYFTKQIESRGRNLTGPKWKE